ncbi:MAG: hypothetical protein ACREP9_18895, partial [Candidatus Dormibacteraceae bacterium]
MKRGLQIALTVELRCMPSPLRQSDSRLLQIPWTGLLPSPRNSRFGSLFPYGRTLRRGRVHLMLRPATLLLLASTLGSPLTPEV